MYLMSTKLMEAIDFAAQKHFNQLRRDKITPYLTHPLSVALIVSKMGCDENTIIATILHDTLEDTNTTENEIENKFGKEVLSLVLECTDIKGKGYSREYVKNESLDRIKKLSVNAAKLKYSDILCNNIDLLVKIRIDKKFANIFSTPIEEKMAYEYKRLNEFKIHHKGISTIELQQCLDEIKINLELT